MPFAAAAAIGGGASLLGGYLQGEAAKSAANTSAQAQLEAARLGAQQAAFRPVGVTTGFGTSNFVMGPDGRLQSASYNLNQPTQQQFNTLTGIAGQNLGQYQQGQQAAQPLMQGAQGMFNLGQQYLQQSPQAQAQQWMQQQQALLEPANTTALNNLRTNLFNTGRSGLAIGGDGGLQATNPEMAAYYNSLAQQQNTLVANANQQGQANAQFGANMLNAGGGMLSNYYGAQNAALSPYTTALNAAQNVDVLGQNALGIGQSLGAGNQQSGGILAQGGQNAAITQQAGNSYNPLGTGLINAGNMLMNYQWPSSSTSSAPMTSPAMLSGGSYPMGSNYSSLTNQIAANPMSIWRQ